MYYAVLHKTNEMLLLLRSITQVYVYLSLYIDIYTSVNPCIKCMECSVTQFGVSELCETLTGGFTR